MCSEGDQYYDETSGTCRVSTCEVLGPSIIGEYPNHNINTNLDANGEPRTSQILDFSNIPLIYSICLEPTPCSNGTRLPDGSCTCDTGYTYENNDSSCFYMYIRNK